MDMCRNTQEGLICSSDRSLRRARAESFTDCLVVHTMVQSIQPGDRAEAHARSDASVGNGSVPGSVSGLEL
jgi:hypothetical protein